MEDFFFFFLSAGLNADCTPRISTVRFRGKRKTLLRRERFENVKKPVKTFRAIYPEKRRGRTALERAVFDFRLFRQVLGALYRRVHPFHRQERRQVGRVRRDHDEREEPPHARHYPGGHGPGTKRQAGVSAVFRPTNG